MRSGAHDRNGFGGDGSTGVGGSGGQTAEGGVHVLFDADPSVICGAASGAARSAKREQYPAALALARYPPSVRRGTRVRCSRGGGGRCHRCAGGRRLALPALLPSSCCPSAREARRVRPAVVDQRERCRAATAHGRGSGQLRWRLRLRGWLGWRLRRRLCTRLRHWPSRQFCAAPGVIDAATRVTLVLRRACCQLRLLSGFTQRRRRGRWWLCWWRWCGRRWHCGGLWRGVGIHGSASVRRLCVLLGLALAATGMRMRAGRQSSQWRRRARVMMVMVVVVHVVVMVWGALRQMWGAPRRVWGALRQVWGALRRVWGAWRRVWGARRHMHVHVCM
jgi:hypothetical protein